MAAIGLMSCFGDADIERTKRKLQRVIQTDETRLQDVQTQTDQTYSEGAVPWFDVPANKKVEGGRDEKKNTTPLG